MGAAIPGRVKSHRFAQEADRIIQAANRPAESSLEPPGHLFIFESQNRRVTTGRGDTPEQKPRILRGVQAS